jgi:hypothetical protein
MSETPCNKPGRGVQGLQQLAARGDLSVLPCVLLEGVLGRARDRQALSRNSTIDPLVRITVVGVAYDCGAMG